jgi:heme/copper-type cytochrome/quinol oxidase subunit 1
MGMPRRMPTSTRLGWTRYNSLSTIGALLIGVSALVF